ncbi:PTS sugar transporter subunit IIA, partial [Liquorilactobacillus nagelii]
IILISHGPFCVGLLKTLNMIVGNTTVSAIPLNEGEDPNQYRQKLEREVSKNSNGDQVLVFCDLKGGTPYNTAAYLSNRYKINIVTGMNLPMLIAVITDFDSNPDINFAIKVVENTNNQGISVITPRDIGGHKNEKLSIDKSR